METRRGHSGAALLSRAAGRTSGRGDPGPDTDSGRTHSRWRRRDTLPAKAGRAAGYAGGRARASRARATAPPRGGCGAQAGRGRGGGADIPAEGPSLHRQEGRWRSRGGLGSKATRLKPTRSAPGRLSPGAGGRRPEGMTAAAPETRPAQDGDGGWTAVSGGRARAAVSVRCDSQERLPPRLRFVRLERGEAADAEKLGVSAPSGFQGRRHGRAAEPASPPAQTSSLDREFRCQGLCRAHPEPQELRPFPKSSHFPLSGQSPGPSQEIPVSLPLGTGRRPGSFFGRSTFTL